MLQSLFLSERNVITAILLNALIVTWMYFPGYHDNSMLLIADKLLTLFFVLEAIAKIRVLGSRTYFSTPLHRFDFILILLGLPSFLEGLIHSPDTSFLLLLRVLRLLRLLRFLQFIPHIDRILSGLGRAVKSSFLVLIVLAFFNFLLAIFTCHFYGSIVPDLFGDPVTAMFSIFQMFTVEGWYEIPDRINQALLAQDDPNAWIGAWFLILVTKLYFALIVLFGGIFGLSLANAVFVDEMTMDNTDEIDHKVDDLNQRITDLQTQLDEVVRLLKERA